MRSVDSVIASLQPFDDSKRFDLQYSGYASKPWQCELVITSGGRDRIALIGSGDTATAAANELLQKYLDLFRLDAVRTVFCPPSLEYSPSSDDGF